MHSVKERLSLMERRHLVIACAIVLLLAAAVICITVLLVAKTQSPSTTADITLSGEVVCLPHKNTTGPQTLECAIGLRSDDNHYYGLQNDARPIMQVGQRVSIQGTLTPAADSLYDIVGTIKVKQQNR